MEELIARARHVEVQILGDRSGHVAHLSERECSVQRRFQKLLEIAPSPSLDDKLRKQIIEAAVRLARSVGYFNLGTFEFLVDVSGRKGAQPFAFIEANAGAAPSTRSTDRRSQRAAPAASSPTRRQPRERPRRQRT